MALQRFGMAIPRLSDYRALAERRPPAEGPAPLVSIVTVALNAGHTLPRALASVGAERGDLDLEHIVVDGGSMDGSQELIAAVLGPRDYWISEPDRGISDAFNKGIALARGRYIQIVNADDRLSPGQLAAGIQRLAGSDAAFVFGDCLVHDGDVPLYRYKGSADYAQQIGSRMHAINHPSMMVPWSSYARHGLFAPEWRYAMDYEWILRVTRAGGQGLYDPRITAHIGAGGVSDQRYRQAQHEVRDISIRYGRPRAEADLECWFQIAKMSTGRAVKRRLPLLHDLLRARLNGHFRPVAPP
jgi:glycosyltransferase involved in cell wall biosynthesis